MDIQEILGGYPGGTGNGATTVTGGLSPNIHRHTSILEAVSPGIARYSNTYLCPPSTRSATRVIALQFPLHLLPLAAQSYWHAHCSQK